MNEKLIQAGFDYAKEVYAAKGIDVEKAMKKAAAFTVSMHCWQGDDVMGLEADVGGTSGGIQTTGNYPGRARNGDELRADFLKAISLIPGKKKLNLHASYAELHGKKIDRDEYTAEQFADWMAFAKENKLALDFNPTYFGHPRVADGFSLASSNESNRRFWIEHGKRCREIGEAFGKAQGQPCVINHWMPDGYKDTPADTDAPRKRMVEALDEVFEATKSISSKHVLDAVESKLFGIGVESYTVCSHEFVMGYALKQKILALLDMGHFHLSENVADKISSFLMFFGKVAFHISRPVRWDSDHVIRVNDDLRNAAHEIVRMGPKNFIIALDYFDASINRVAAWVLGMRNMQKALLEALLEPKETLKELQDGAQFTEQLVLQEELKTYPMGAVWEEFCARAKQPANESWMAEVLKYERDVQSKRV